MTCTTNLHCTRRAPTLFTSALHTYSYIHAKRHASHATSLASRHRQPAVPRQQAECTLKTPVRPLRDPRPLLPFLSLPSRLLFRSDSRVQRSERACVRVSERDQYEAIGRDQVADGDAAITVLHDERRVWYEPAAVDSVSRLDDGIGAGSLMCLIVSSKLPRKPSKQARGQARRCQAPAAQQPAAGKSEQSQSH